MFISKVELGREGPGEGPRGLATLFTKALIGYSAHFVSPEQSNLEL